MHEGRNELTYAINYFNDCFDFYHNVWRWSLQSLTFSTGSDQKGVASRFN